MLKPLYISATDDTPKIVLDAGKNIFDISGRSLPEDAGKFYSPLITWFSEYIKSPVKTTQIKFNLDYFNSSSARLIVKILIMLEELVKTGNAVKIVWAYKENDEVMRERGEEIKNVVNIPLIFETY